MPTPVSHWVTPFLRWLPSLTRWTIPWFTTTRRRPVWTTRISLTTCTRRVLRRRSTLKGKLLSLLPAWAGGSVSLFLDLSQPLIVMIRLTAVSSWSVVKQVINHNNAPDHHISNSSDQVNLARSAWIERFHFRRFSSLLSFFSFDFRLRLAKLPAICIRTNQRFLSKMLTAWEYISGGNFLET